MRYPVDADPSVSMKIRTVSMVPGEGPPPIKADPATSTKNAMGPRLGTTPKRTMSTSGRQSVRASQAICNSVRPTQTIRQTVCPAEPIGQTVRVTETIRQPVRPADAIRESVRSTEAVRQTVRAATQPVRPALQAVRLASLAARAPG